VLRETDRKLLRLVREHLDLEELLRAHPEVTRAHVEALWAKLGLASRARDAGHAPDLFEPPAGRAEGHLPLVVRCDGAARGNPGPASVGAVVQDAEGTTLLEVSERIGYATNNVAEYTAVIRGVEEARRLGATAVHLLLDSDLLVQQLRGAYRVRSAHLRPLYQRSMELLGGLREWRVDHVPRSENAAADRLANLALDHR